MKWFWLAIYLTVFNFGWDWLFKTPMAETIAWEGGIIQTIYCAWLMVKVTK